MTESPGSVSAGWRWASWLSLWLLIVYMAIVLPLERVVPALHNRRVFIVLLLLSAIGLHAALGAFIKRLPNAAGRVKDAFLASATLLVSLLAADTVFTAYRNMNPTFVADSIYAERLRDPNVWDGELIPEEYRPTNGNFHLYKPLQERTALVYGELYYTGLLKHRVLREQVLEPQLVRFRTDRYGLRNDIDASTARVFVLGDSFCFGYHTTQDAIVPKLLADRIGQPVYNLCVAATSPKSQLLLLEHLLRTNPEAFRPRQLLWFIFEGNDLEESYDETEEEAAPRGSLNPLFAGTMVGEILGVPAVLRQQSIIRLVLGAQLSFRSAFRQTTQDHFELDNERLVSPLYHSTKFGYQLMRQVYLDRAVQPMSYVLNHPNRPRLIETFGRMKALASKHGFSVTTVLVPSNVRLYKNDFDDLPQISDEPCFIRYLQTLSDETGFAYVDLYSLLREPAASELLYYRDDTHWNKRGHEVVSDLLAQHLKWPPAD
jgi:SGNH hydrolase-like domain, acetyltransferase AlgX